MEIINEILHIHKPAMVFNFENYRLQNAIDKIYLSIIRFRTNILRTKLLLNCKQNTFCIIKNNPMDAFIENIRNNIILINM